MREPGPPTGCGFVTPSGLPSLTVLDLSHLTSGWVVLTRGRSWVAAWWAHTGDMIGYVALAIAVGTDAVDIGIAAEIAPSS